MDEPIFHKDETETHKAEEEERDLTVSLVGARISSIIMLSRAKELRLRVLDLSELKERRLHVTRQPSAAATTSDGQGKHKHKTQSSPLLHATSREPRLRWTRVQQKEGSGQ